MSIYELSELIAAEVLSRAASSGEIKIKSGRAADGRTYYQAEARGGKFAIWGAYSPEDLAKAIVDSIIPSLLTLEDSADELDKIAEWMAKNGAKGGAATTDAKTAAARENGKKGGRPRKEKP